MLKKKKSLPFVFTLVVFLMVNYFNCIKLNLKK